MELWRLLHLRGKRRKGVSKEKIRKRKRQNKTETNKKLGHIMKAKKADPLKKTFDEQCRTSRL